MGAVVLVPYSILYTIILFIIAIGLFYFAYRLLKAEKDAALEILRYVVVIFLGWLAVCSIITAITAIAALR